MRVDFERLAQFGTAPVEGCGEFGVGYEDAFHRIKERFIIRSFARGGSTEKFVVGPFGSGKTHFVRQLSDIARAEGCVTAEVKLTRDVDLTYFPMVYRQITQEIRSPGGSARGVAPLLRACLELVAEASGLQGAAQVEITTAWASGLLYRGLQLDAFARVANIAFDALVADDTARFEAACRWLAGNVTDKDVARAVGAEKITQQEESVFTRGMLFSLFQLVRAAGFRGSVVVLDEAEQSMQVAQKNLNFIFSVMQSLLNNTTDAEAASAMIVYAITPSVRERIDTFPALQQRLSSPTSFFDGNDLAPVIDLTWRDDPEAELHQIASKLVDVFVAQEGLPASETEDDLRSDVAAIAARVAADDPSSQSRRTVVKGVCTRLLRDNGFAPPPELEPEV